ncbi:MAG: DNA alkylation repair protein [bacterium]|nr:DNA alkylation repair protein [bacterium]
MASLPTIKRAIRSAADPSRAAACARFFKTGAGEYAQGDQFLGVTVPTMRTIAKQYHACSFTHAEQLLQSRSHEDRFVALLLLIARFNGGDAREQRAVYQCYLHNTVRVNNWDLVDTSAYHIVGAYLLRRPRGVLARLARSPQLWERRIAIVATYAFIRHGQLTDTFRIAQILLRDPHDLIHKATGWMLREAGKRSTAALETFLRLHAAAMPRTMLRSAIERLPSDARSMYLHAHA